LRSNGRVGVVILSKFRSVVVILEPPPWPSLCFGLPSPQGGGIRKHPHILRPIRNAGFRKRRHVVVKRASEPQDRQRDRGPRSFAEPKIEVDQRL
jgi:hypothetical protein